MYITFEGIDGSGKSTQCELLSQYLKTLHLDHIVTKEPGGTPTGTKIRELLLNKQVELSPTSQIILFMADRIIHDEQVIKPALANDRIVISDRGIDSMIAYQGYGNEQSPLYIRTFYIADTNIKIPDITFLLDISMDEMQRRLKAKNNNNDRYETKDTKFYERVIQGYTKQARTFPNRIHVIDGHKNHKEIFMEIIEYLDDKLLPIMPK